jgi:hypothetical protein
VCVRIFEPTEYVPLGNPTHARAHQNREPVRNPVALICMRGGMTRDNESRWL